MTLYEFNALSTEQQLSTVWMTGTFLASRAVQQSHLSLYALEAFYIEIRYNAERNAVTACRPFRNPINLEPYLTQINLGSIIPNP